MKMRKIRGSLILASLMLMAGSCVCPPDPAAQSPEMLADQPPSAIQVIDAPTTTTTTTTTTSTTTTTIAAVPVKAAENPVASVHVSVPAPVPVKSFSAPEPATLEPMRLKVLHQTESFSPDGDGVGDTMLLGLLLSHPENAASWRFEIAEESPAGAASAKLCPFVAWNGAGAPPSSISWDGRGTRGESVESATDYPYIFSVVDIRGTETKVSGVIPVDVLVLREGTTLKIRVPSIIFRANYADFIDLAPETVARNSVTLARVARILDRYADYSILIEGHANNVGKIYGHTAAAIADEEKREVLPLSTARAAFVRMLLSLNGVDASRMSVRGRGSSEPVYSFANAAHRWKNRRVEFILRKK